MKGQVINLYDINGITLPENLLTYAVDNAQVDEKVNALSLRYADETLPDKVAAGDIVFCSADGASYPDGRTVIIYTNGIFESTAHAQEDLLLKAVGDSVNTTLKGKDVCLTVNKILRRTPATVSDALIASLNIENVATVADYRTYAENKLIADIKMEKNKELTRFVLDTLIENSTYIYDEGDLAEYTEKFVAEYLAVYPEETANHEEIGKFALRQAKQNWIAKAIADANGYTVDLKAIEEETDRMVEMMTLMGEEVPQREEMLDMAQESEYQNYLFDFIDKFLAEKTEG